MLAPLIDSEDFQALFAHAQTMRRPAHYVLLLTLMRDLGLRPIELARMERSWFRGEELRIPHGRSKRGRARTLPISPAIKDALIAHIGERDGRLFVNREGQPFTPAQMSASVRRLFAEAGVQGSAYSARRSMATRLMDRDVNIIVLQNILGHSEASTTARYCQVSTTKMASVLGFWATIDRLPLN